MRLLITVCTGRCTTTLERLTKPSDLAHADESAGECREGQIDVGASFVADGQAAVAVQPGEGAFHHPAVPPEVGAALDPPPGDAWDDAAGTAFTAQRR